MRDPSPSLEPLALAWLADMLEQLAAVLARRSGESSGDEQLLIGLPPLREAVGDWTRLLERQAAGRDMSVEAWSGKDRIVRGLSEVVASQWGAGPDAPDLAPVDSIQGRILSGAGSRSFTPDPFSDAVAVLGDASRDEVGRLAAEAGRSERRAVDSIDACLRALAPATG